MTKTTENAEAVQAAASALLDAAMAAARREAEQPGRRRIAQHLAVIERAEKRRRDTQPTPSTVAQFLQREALAAVCLHVLVTDGLSEFVDITRSVERNIRKPDEREEVQVALGLLQIYGLADRNEDGGWIATLPARTATVRLSF